jgi:hypothetical protein
VCIRKRHDQSIGSLIFGSIARKLKCDGGKPQCQQCMRRTVDCEYEVSVKRRGLGKTTAAVSPQRDMNSDNLPAAGAPGDSNEGRVGGQVKTVACQFCRGKNYATAYGAIHNFNIQLERPVAMDCNRAVQTAKSETWNVYTHPIPLALPKRRHTHLLLQPGFLPFLALARLQPDSYPVQPCRLSKLFPKIKVFRVCYVQPPA